MLGPMFFEVTILLSLTNTVLLGCSLEDVVADDDVDASSTSVAALLYTSGENYAASLCHLVKG